MPKKIVGAKIALLDCSLQKAKMHLGVQVVIDDPEKLDAIRQRYFNFTHQFVSYQNICTFMCTSISAHTRIHAHIHAHAYTQPHACMRMHTRKHKQARTHIHSRKPMFAEL